jgi:hypothetical protein
MSSLKESPWLQQILDNTDGEDNVKVEDLDLPDTFTMEVVDADGNVLLSRVTI